MQREWRDRERKLGRVDGSEEEEDVVVWARWDSRPEENANEPRGRAESERRRMVWWFGGDCGAESLVRTEHDDCRFEAESFGEEIAGVSSVDVICCLPILGLCMYVGKYAGKEHSLDTRRVTSSSDSLESYTCTTFNSE